MADVEKAKQWLNTAINDYNGTGHGMVVVMRDSLREVLSVIEAQQAEIERLKSMNEELAKLNGMD